MAGVLRLPGSRKYVPTPAATHSSSTTIDGSASPVSGVPALVSWPPCASGINVVESTAAMGCDSTLPRVIRPLPDSASVQRATPAPRGEREVYNDAGSMQVMAAAP